MTKGEILELLQTIKSSQPHGSRKLGILQVQDILRDEKSTAAELASLYDVSGQLIADIRCRRASYFSDAGNPGEADMVLANEPARDYRKHRNGRPRVLTDFQILTIKLTEIPITILAKEFGVSYGCVRNARIAPYDPPDDSSDGDAFVFESAGKKYFRRDLREMADAQPQEMRVAGRVYSAAELVSGLETIA